MAHHGAGERHALALPARKLRRLAREQRGEAEALGDARDLLGDAAPRGGRAGHQPPQQRHPLPRRKSAHLERQADVLRDRHVGVERVALEHHGEVAALGRQRANVPLADPHLAGIGGFQPRQDPQQRGLAATGGAEDGNELALLRLQRDAAQHRRGAEALLDPEEGDAGHGRGRNGCPAPPGWRFLDRCATASVDLPAQRRAPPA